MSKIQIQHIKEVVYVVTCNYCLHELIAYKGVHMITFIEVWQKIFDATFTSVKIGLFT